jgi:hypothetical protein
MTQRQVRLSARFPKIKVWRWSPNRKRYEVLRAVEEGGHSSLSSTPDGRKGSSLRLGGIAPTVLVQLEPGWNHQSLCELFLNIFIAPTVYTTRARTSYKIVPLTNLNDYLHNDISVTEINFYVSVNNSSENFIQKNTATSGLFGRWEEERNQTLQGTETRFSDLQLVAG